MSVSSEVTISPVLLQAISQTLTSKDRLLSPTTNSINMQPSIQIKQEMMEGIKTDVTAGHILQGMNVPVFEKSRSSPTSGFERSGSHEDQHGGSKELENPSESPGAFVAGLTQEQIKNMIRWKLDSQQLQGQGQNDNSDTIIIQSSEGDVSMVNVLSALASHHLKSTVSPVIEKDKIVTATSLSIPQPVISIPTLVKDNQSANNKENKSNHVSELVVTHDDADKQVIICYDNQGNAPVPSPVNDVVVSESGQTVNVVIEQDGQRFYMHDSLSERGGGDDVQTVRPARYEDGSLVITGPMSHTVTSTQNVQSIGMDLSHTTTVSGSLPPEPTMTLGPCPICGDGISGYHYGIFTCESCKGFFKRTVQNKKSFACHRKGDCDITKGSRKKCPACRFAKCLIMGMKLEAIRPDRMRGGRSSYDGCSPHGRPKNYPLEMKMQRKKSVSSAKNIKLPHHSTAIPKSLENIHVTLPTGEDISGSQLMAILNRNGKAVSEEVKPFVPHLLTEIMNVESYLCEDENSTDFPPERLSENDPSFMLSLLQLAELRLYKLVRWARNLPQFSAIATDDQILLLQNCWADLLLFNCCMRSIQSSTEIFLPMGKSIDMEKAEKLGHGADEIVSRLLAITEQLRRLQVDQYEFVALKVMMLITPDVKGLKEPQKAQENQDSVCEALGLYTNSHYPQHPNKFGEMLLRLPEISRVSMIGKEILNTVMPPEFTSCGLLFELLKGDGLKDDT